MKLPRRPLPYLNILFPPSVSSLLASHSEFCASRTSSGDCRTRKENWAVVGRIRRPHCHLVTISILTCLPVSPLLLARPSRCESSPRLSSSSDRRRLRRTVQTEQADCLLASRLRNPHRWWMSMPESCSVMVTVASPLFCLPSLVWTELLVDPRHRTDEVYVWDGAEAGVRVRQNPCWRVG